MSKKAAAGAAASSGTSFFGVLALIFIVMKVMGWGAVANWDWWLVLSPLWIELALAAVFVIGILIFLKITGEI